MKLLFIRGKQRLLVLDDKEKMTRAWECRGEFEAGYNESGQARAALPDGRYILPTDAASITAEYGDAYGTFYISTGDPRGRDIHGGGSGLSNPYAPRQGWVVTYGCLRMQNEDGEALCRMISSEQATGKNVELIVTEKADDYQTALKDLKDKQNSPEEQAALKKKLDELKGNDTQLYGVGFECRYRKDYVTITKLPKGRTTPCEPVYPDLVTVADTVPAWVFEASRSMINSERGKTKQA